MALIDLSWMMALGIMFGLAFVMTVLTFRNMNAFIVWLNVFAGFTVWAGLLDVWILVLTLIALTIIIVSNIKKRSELG